MRRLRAAGAVIVGKTTMPELGLWPFTESVTWGVTRNPWDVERTPGGSSGGSAAAVAAGLVPAALAADGAGSIRIPAACSGPVRAQAAARPRAARAARPRRQPLDLSSAPLTRSVLDTAIVLDVMAGPPGTSFERRRPPRSPGALRIAVSDALPAGVQGRLAPEVRGALERHRGRSCARSATRSWSATSTSARATSPVILGLLFRGIHDFVAEVERPQPAGAPHPRARAARAADLRPRASSGCWRRSGA